MDDPKLNSTDREERILARRRRIAERQAAKLKGKEGELVGEETKAIGKGEQQTIESRKRLYKIRAQGDDKVTDIRVAGDNRENYRRIEEEARRQELRGKLLAEAEHSARHNATVAMRWADLFSIEVPQELYEQIEKQREACTRITDSKDRLIKEINNELKAKDDEYVKALKKQAEDIDQLLKFMGHQFRELQVAFAEELEEIESAFKQERMELINANKAEMAGLFDKRSAREQKFMDDMLETAEDYQRQLEEERVQNAEDYNILKIRLETDIQNLEQHLEAMRATYQLNTEKLEYNYRVLVERDHENQSTINQQKRKIARQRDILSNLKAKYAELDRRFQEENMKLTDEYKRITEQFKDLQAKYRHFETADTQRYVDVWDMNEGVAAELVHKVLRADKIIHEQQLAVSWNPPDDELFVSPMKEADKHENEEGEQDAAEAAAQALRERMEDPKYRALLRLLVSESGFLVDAKLARALEGAVGEDGDALRADSIVRALGISDGPAFDALVACLSEGGELPEEGDPREPVLIHPDEAAKRLKDFVESEAAAAPTVSGKRMVSSKGRKADREKEFWERMSNVISPKMFRVWGALEKNLGKYNRLLNSRAEALDETASLQRQNEELRVLLNQYLSSRINEELQIPPTQVI
mmetsp:Transcript_4676/g.15483  ORF Transcript_4676/g.15483 Transcript_4676/m.15483 type:complete len:645 (+) Transcript_4676:346-2280(+)